MHTCKDAVELLFEFVEGDMPEDEREHLIEHLQGCSPCVDFLRMYQATPDLCRRAVAARMPQELADKLTSFLRGKLRK
jgi:anti-sigma factor (TIGR02949 family)